MAKSFYTFKANVWLYPGMAGWHFITVPKKLSAEIQETHKSKKAGFGSIRVAVTVGETAWETSIFPDKKSGSYLLPLKAQIRKKEGIEQGSKLEVKLEI